MSGLGWEKAPARLALGYTSRSSVLIKAPVFGGRGGWGFGACWGHWGAGHLPPGVCAHRHSHAGSWGGGGQEGYGPGGCRRRGP